MVHLCQESQDVPSLGSATSQPDRNAIKRHSGRSLTLSSNYLSLGQHKATRPPRPAAGGKSMTITQQDRDLGTAYAMKPAHTRTELTSVGRGTPMGELLRRYWHPVGLVGRRRRYAEEGARAGRGFDPVPRQARPRRPGPRALLPPRHDALLRQGRGGRHPLLLSRLDVRHRRPLPGAALRARRRPVQGQGAPALVSGRGALRVDLRLYGPGREKAGAAALRMPRKHGRRRVRRGRRFLDRRRRRRDHALQLAAAFRERGRSLPRAGAARLVLRAAIHQHDGLDAGGEVRDVAARRHRALDPQAGRRQGVLPRHRSRPPHAARGAEPARGAVRPRRIDRLDAADRRHLVPHLRRRPRQDIPATSAGCARSSTANSGGT